ncbi:IS256 family transposase [Vallitalea longa]|uniref:Mutator family transposase n=1 Tax=Vallitalea longa TaxID=2936439 RepID=A0A9W5YC83_9FIRM|nr:IS256 family transposase [Vallitalea longa]GKX28603.1 IS256 family transposase [Vallitalea longa]
MANNLITKEQAQSIIENNDIKTPQDIMGALKNMFKDVIQEMLENEMDETLGYERYDHDQPKSNYRNGYSQKKVRSSLGEIDIDVPRDRNADFEPKIVPKRKKDISDIEKQIISLYARGMSTRDIHEQMNELYGINVSADMVSRITDKLIPTIKEWQGRPLEPIYPFVFMDAIHFKVRTEGRVINRAAYVIIGVNLDGMKDVLGIWIGENESSKFWLNILNQLSSRGVKDVLIFSVDGLSGIKEAIQTVYPQAEIQRCIIHQLRNSFKFVSYKDYKEFTRDFKEVYRASSEDLALLKLDELEDKWGSKYPHALTSWRKNWDVLCTFFKFPDDIRRIMYTSNVIENLNRQYRKVTKSKCIFPTDTSLQKMLFLATDKATKKWTQRYRGWDKILNQLTILYNERITPYIG